MTPDTEATEVIEGAKKFAETLSGSRNAVDVAVAHAILRLANIAERHLYDTESTRDDLRSQVAILNVRNQALEDYTSRLEKLPYDVNDVHTLTGEIIDALNAAPSELGAQTVKALIQQDATLMAQKQVLEDQRELLRSTTQREGELQSKIWRAQVALQRGNTKSALEVLQETLS